MKRMYALSLVMGIISSASMLQGAESASVNSSKLLDMSALLVRVDRLEKALELSKTWTFLGAAQTLALHLIGSPGSSLFLGLGIGVSNHLFQKGIPATLDFFFGEKKKKSVSQGYTESSTPAATA